MRSPLPINAVFCLACMACSLVAAPAWGQFDKPKEVSGENGPKYAQPIKQLYKVGVVIRAVGGPCAGLFATIPMPAEWPEQKVKVVLEEFAPTAQVKYRNIDGGIRQMLIEIPNLPAGETAKVILSLEVTKSAVVGPTDTASFVIPKTPPKEVRKFLVNSPSIDISQAKIKTFAKQLAADKEGAWAQVEAIYDGVREKVKLENEKPKGALGALKDGKADKEDLTGLFVACCRTQKIPARMVWITDGCYAEFFLDDADGKGNWFPCLVAGNREFGSLSDHRPILQKGDSMKVPERKDAVRFVPEYLTGKGGTGGKPDVEFIRRLEAMLQ